MSAEDRKEPGSDGASSEFADPLADYDAPVASCPLEQALIDENVTAMETQPYTAVTSRTSIGEVINILAQNEIACALVTDDEHRRLLGIVTERDILKKVAADYERQSERAVSEIMSSPPAFVYATEPSAAALCVMTLGGYRHVPVLGEHDQVVGIVSPRRVAAFLLDRGSRDEEA